MDYRDAALFTRVVETGSFTAAAATAGLPKSSLSRRIARLERDLGVRLLQRTTRKLTLTEAGQEFFERVRRAVVGLEEAASTAREADGEPRGLVRVTAPTDSASMGVGAAIADFAKRYPAIQVELSLTPRLVDLVGEGFDIAIRAGRLEDSSLVARRVGSMDFALFAAPSYVRRRGRPQALADLARHDCIVFRPRNGRSRWVLVGPRGEESIEITGRIGADEFAFITHLARQGAGVALLPIGLARTPIRERELVHLLPEYSAPGAPLSVVLPSSEFVPSRVALLRDALIEWIGRELQASQRECSAQRALPRERKPRRASKAVRRQ